MKLFYKTIKKSMLLAFAFILISSYSGFALTHFNKVWQGENGQNHMNFLVVSAISEDLPLSVDDELAVFSGSNCVGVAKLTKSINPLDNTSFLSISASQDDGSTPVNGFIANDDIVFKIWDYKNQKEMVAKAVTYKSDVASWSTNGQFTAGATAVVELVFYAELTQTINLIKGYNMISTYVMPKNPDVSIVTQSLMNQGFLVKMIDEAGKTYENLGTFGGWTNNLGSLDKTKGYKIKVSNNCSVQITGRPIILPLNISLKAGWNIISFPLTTAVNALSIIQTLIDQNKLIKVQDESGNSIENWGVFGGWQNGIGNFVSGKAYKVKLSADATLSIQQTYIKSMAVQSKSGKTDYFLSKVEGNGVDQMNINIVGLKSAGFSADDELAAFDGNVCVGVLKLTEDQIISGASLVASFSTDDLYQDGFKEGDLIQLHAWNHLTGVESLFQTRIINGQMIYEKNASIMVKANAMTTGLTNIDRVAKIEIFPNPSFGNVNVRFSELPNAGSRIDILDLSGRSIASRYVSGTSEIFNLAGVPSGIYLVRAAIGSSESIHKLVVQ